jgi:hypothetical protein
MFAESSVVYCDDGIDYCDEDAAVGNEYFCLQLPGLYTEGESAKAGSEAYG